MRPVDAAAAGPRTGRRASGPRTDRNRHEREFLPAAIEIVETPPSPTGRALALAVAALFLLAVAWSAVGRVDIVAVAPGRIVPTGNSKIVQPLETAIVTAIHVRDGQLVRAGDKLIDLDTTASIAEARRLATDRDAARLDAARLRALLADGRDHVAPFAPPDDASTDAAAVQRQLLESQRAAQAAKIAAIDRQMQQRRAERATALATIAKIEASIPFIRERFEIRDDMAKRQLGSRIAQLENKQALSESQRELAVQQSHLATIDAAMAVLEEQRAEGIAEFRRQAAAELAEAERKSAALAEDLVKARTRTRLLTLTAPIDGTVQQLAVHTVGGVVTSAQPVLVVVPNGAHLQIEAMVSNRDIGFVRAGQPVEIKIDAFDFTRYGLVHGVVESLSQDAIVKDRAGERGARGEQRGGDGGGGQDLGFAARIGLSKTRLDVDGSQVNLAAGMTVTVEIKTGQRSVLSFLLSPIARYRQDALRER